ncbi:Vacuolar protein sorting-associated protein 53 [Perkinsus olseni]|uniref:Vacuolar protein sorting-associated protein 53 n=2 Tax=Perkinsus olseni TaxID=32597 RepID=A0A7J6N4J1_PEROL|nr:Vacuolar protein sorting-associated protein 53 [Perkinsus olseni]
MYEDSEEDYGDVDLPPELLAALAQSPEVDSDPLEQPEFDVVEYVNDMFPDEGSLKDVDAKLANIESEISELDKEIDRGVRDYAQRAVDGDAEKALKAATAGVEELDNKD